MHNSKIVRVAKSHEYRINSKPMPNPNADAEDFLEPGSESPPKYDKSIRKVRRFIDDIKYVDAETETLNATVYLEGSDIILEIEN
jgi:hypothetical protein